MGQGLTALVMTMGGHGFMVFPPERPLYRSGTPKCFLGLLLSAAEIAVELTLNLRRFVGEYRPIAFHTML